MSSKRPSTLADEGGGTGTSGARATAPDDQTSSAPSRSHSFRSAAGTVLFPMGGGLLVIAAWHLLVASGVVNEILVPPPMDVLSQIWTDLISLATGGPMLGHFMATLSEIVIGFLGATALAIVLGVLLSESRLFRRVTYPYVIALSTMPRIAFAPLLIIWFGFGLTSKAVMVALIAAFPILVNTVAGLQATDRAFIKLMRSLGSTRMQTFRKVRIPTALPYVFAGLESGIIFAAVGAVVAEFTSGKRGLGYLTLVGQEVFDLPLTFSAIVILSVQGVVLHRIIVLIRRRVIFWHSEQSDGLRG